jgi:nitroreductase
MIELLRRRRSIRKFSAEKISAEARQIIIEAALRSPSSRGINPWEFVLIEDPKLLGQLAEAKQHGSQFLKNAPFAIVVCGDSSASDVWIEDCSIAAIVIQMTALSLGLGSCWAQIRNRQYDDNVSAEAYVQQLLGLPDEMKVECIIGIGHPDEIKKPVAADTLPQHKIRNERWS